jgi:response regulator RpfG family c-di-GMP phosphodiesterase
MSEPAFPGSGSTLCSGEITVVDDKLDFERWATHLAGVSTRLMETNDLNAVLECTLTEARHLTHSDAGTIYRVVGEEDDLRLRFATAQNDSVNLSERTHELPLDETSLAGWSALNRRILFVEDAYDLPEEAPYSLDHQFDDQHGYRSRSMLVVPLVTPDGSVEGVLQLINRKRHPDRGISETEVVEFPESLGELTRALASVAAAAIQRAGLQRSLRTMLDSIIETLVAALDERDQSVTGHSRRLARLTDRLVRAVNESDNERWRDVRIDEDQRDRLRYAALLHDIGKIAVPEAILNKENRLSQDRMLAIQHRLEYLDASDQSERLPERSFERLESINRARELTEEDQQFLEELRTLRHVAPDGDKRPVLTEEEFRHLSVPEGTLTEAELLKMRDHVRQTRTILDTVEWTDRLEPVAKLAALHHEMLDGSGYPDGLTGEEIPLGGRILAVGDIYEALTARDRPYRPPPRSPPGSRDPC